MIKEQIIEIVESEIESKYGSKISIINLSNISEKVESIVDAEIIKFLEWMARRDFYTHDNNLFTSRISRLTYLSDSLLEQYKNETYEKNQ